MTDSKIETGKPAWLIMTAVVSLVIFFVLVFMMRKPNELVESPGNPSIDQIDSQEIWSLWIEEAAAGTREEIRNNDFLVTDEMLSQVARAQSLATLILDHGHVTSAQLHVLAALPKLYHLRLRLSAITDEGLLKLSQSKSLSILNIPHANCSAAGVAHLANLPDLRQLRLGSPQLGDEVSETLAKLLSLRSIHLIGVPITDEGLKQIATLPKLQSLYLDDSAVTETGWQWLFENHGDLHVHIDQRHHDRDPHQHQHDRMDQLESKQTKE